MKNQVIKITRNTDYVRFGFDVTVQTKIGLEITAGVWGDITKGEGRFQGIDFINIDDNHWEELRFGGEKVDLKGFKETFNKLFKRDFLEFETEIDNLIEVEVQKQFPKSLSHVSGTDLKRIARDYFGNMDLVWCYTPPDTLVQASSSKDWEFHQIIVALSEHGYSKFRSFDGGGSVYGYEKDWLRVLLTKY